MDQKIATGNLLRDGRYCWSQKSVDVEVEDLEMGRHCWDGRSGGLVGVEDNIRAGGLVGQEVVLGKRSCWD
ncbi:hypothetical protein F8M41_000901 [Gigaspora margarita]|uniref:Uncharacterized protein n=1 Tax=Gigaspora margarita TaxID=4874 RepID=A0A8H4A8I3_GIGMA|nr:hypothetical protein F8M41_000901 [Gigaspora margarita]